MENKKKVNKSQKKKPLSFDFKKIVAKVVESKKFSKQSFEKQLIMVAILKKEVDYKKRSVKRIYGEDSSLYEQGVMQLERLKVAEIKLKDLVFIHTPSDSQKIRCEEYKNKISYTKKELKSVKAKIKRLESLPESKINDSVLVKYNELVTQKNNFEKNIDDFKNIINEQCSKEYFELENKLILTQRKISANNRIIDRIRKKIQINNTITSDEKKKLDSVQKENSKFFRQRDFILIKLNSEKEEVRKVTLPVIEYKDKILEKTLQKIEDCEEVVSKAIVDVVFSTYEYFTIWGFKDEVLKTLSSGVFSEVILPNGIYNASDVDMIDIALTHLQNEIEDVQQARILDYQVRVNTLTFSDNTSKIQVFFDDEY